MSCREPGETPAAPTNSKTPPRWWAVLMNPRGTAVTDVIGLNRNFWIPETTRTSNRTTERALATTDNVTSRRTNSGLSLVPSRDDGG